MIKFDNILPDKILNVTEIQSEQEKKKEFRLIGEQRKIRGHKVWEFNKVTKVLSEAQIKKTNATLTSLDPSSVHSEIRQSYIFNTDCEYFQALNRESAEKKLRKLGL